MVKYVKAVARIETYRGIDIGQEDSHNQRYYFTCKNGKTYHNESIDELKARIDEYLEDKHKFIQKYFG